MAKTTREVPMSSVITTVVAAPAEISVAKPVLPTSSNAVARDASAESLSKRTMPVSTIATAQ